MNGNGMNEEESMLGQGPQLVYSLRQLTMEGIQKISVLQLENDVHNWHKVTHHKLLMV